MRMMSVFMAIAKSIPEMKEVLGLASSSAEDAKERKRQESLAQLAGHEGIKDGI